MDFSNRNFMNNTEENFFASVKKRKQLVLFGAGNEMQKAVAKIIMPQDLQIDYIVDNDFRKWYTRYKGVEIREPEYLRNDGNNAVVLITSIYPYRIERQLQRLGVTCYYSSLLFLEEHMNKEQFMVTF